jgi:hypothetical protein
VSGYVRIYRSLIDHPSFRNDAEAMAFAWMVMKAAWRPTRVRYKGHPISLERGQLAISVRDFAGAHDRNKNWVSRILETLRREDMIRTDAGTGVLVITICNYDKYQSEAGNGGTPQGTDVGTAEGQLRDTEQESKNIKKGKDYAFDGQVIRLTHVDYERWLKHYPDLDLAAELQTRDDWLARECDAATQKRWFQSTSRHLANRQQSVGEGRGSKPRSLVEQVLADAAARERGKSGQ